MDSLPSELVNFLQALRPLFRAEVFVSFSHLMVGILIGEAKLTALALQYLYPNGLPTRLFWIACSAIQALPVNPSGGESQPNPTILGLTQNSRFNATYWVGGALPTLHMEALRKS